MAQQVLIYNLTNSAFALGVVSVIGLIPTLPLALWGGSISDRFNKRNVILLTQTSMLVQAFILAFLTWAGRIQVWHVYVMSLFLAAASAIDIPARQAFTVDMVAGKEDLANAIGLNSAMFNGARAIGPSLAGITVAATGVGMAFFLNGLSFIAVIISLLMMKNLPKSSSYRVDEHALDHIVSGLKYTFKNRIIAVLTSMVAVSAFLSMPYNTLLPIYGESILKASASPVVNLICNGPHQIMHCVSPDALPFGILLTAVGIGAVAGSLFVASITSQRRGLLLTLGNLGFPLFLLVMAVSRSFLLSSLALILIGFSFVLQNALANTLLQLESPDEMRGRVMGVYTMSFQVMMRLGGFQAGVVADWVNVPFSVGIGAIISLMYSVFVALRYPSVRKL